MRRLLPFLALVAVSAGQAFLASAAAAQGSQASAQDEMCLACHGDPELRTEAGRSLFVDARRQSQSAHRGHACTTCHTAITDYPHPPRPPKVQCASCHPFAAPDVEPSAHGLFGEASCAACHGDNPHQILRPPQVFPKQCATCHSDAVEGYQSSVHGTLRAEGAADSPTCQSCHGPTHKILPARDPASFVAKKNLPETCGSCHANPDFLARHQIPFARPVESFRLSVHGRAVERGVEEAPSCSDCHASHAVFPGRDQRSKINHWQVPETCGACHTEIQQVYAGSVHGQAVARGVRGAPVCTDCHGEHTILAPSEPESLVNPARVSSVTCGRCHGDERLAARYNLPLDKVPAFEDSFHGLALRAGSQTVANCASCHGVHNILPSSDPRSTVHPANLSRTCGACHPGAGERFAIGPVHVRPATASEHPVVRLIRVAYLVLIPLAVGFMLLHNALDFLAKLIRGSARADSAETVPRMNLGFRIAHWLTIVSFFTLVYTGFALRYSEQWWAAPLLRWEAELAFRGWLHRFAGVVLIAAFVFHLLHVMVSRRDRAILHHLRPGIQDVKDLWGVVLHNLGLSKDRPRFGKFSYAEKIEYLAFAWGTVIMAATGLMLWANNFMLRYFPKWVLDAADAMHFYEAILAALSILIWHFYFVIFDPEVYPMDKAWLTGRASADHLRHNRPAYYLELRRLEADHSARASEPSEKTDSAGSDSAEAPTPDTEKPPQDE